MGNVVSKSLNSLPLISSSIQWDQGILLGANPHNPRDSVYKGVILLFHQTDHNVLGLQINRPVPGMSLTRIIGNLGFELNHTLSNDLVYYGGSLGTNRMHFVHSLDWFSATTVILNNAVGITSDLGIVSAISSSEGPKKYRACAGNWRWDLDTLYDQIYNLDPEAESQDHLWEIAPLTISSVFDSQSDDQWYDVMRSSAISQSKIWMS